MTTRPAPNITIRQLVKWLDLYATEVTTARTILTDRINRAAEGSRPDGGNERVHTSRSTSTTEARALAALEHDQQLTTITNDIDRIRTAIRRARATTNAIMRGPDVEEPEAPRPCKEGQHGKAGAIEWGDPTCDFPADKSGMCQAHYFAWYRHRKAAGIDTSNDFAAA